MLARNEFLFYYKKYTVPVSNGIYLCNPQTNKTNLFNIIELDELRDKRISNISHVNYFCNDQRNADAEFECFNCFF